MVTQRRRHELWSVRLTMVDPDFPRAALALNARAHFSRSGCRFLSADRLLTERVRATDGTWVAAPAAEFGYLMAKSLSRNSPSGSGRDYGYCIVRTRPAPRRWRAVSTGIQPR